MVESLSITEIFVLAAGLLYLVQILLFTLGWFSLSKKPHKGLLPNTRLSIIIPARNEEGHIAALLHTLSKQDYPEELLEIIVVDDHSTDNTAKEIQQFMQEHGGEAVKLYSMQSAHGKKQAISKGVEHASGELIMCTDADCVVGKEWVSAVVRHYEFTKAKFISSPVVYEGEKSFFARFQSLEFLSLIACGAGAISIKMPVMCNGANLAFEKQAFLTVGGYAGNDQFASGDDVFLMFKIKNSYGAKAIQFLKNKKAIVKTKPVQTLRLFLQQRKRWASKSSAYKDFYAIYTAMLIFSFNTFLLVLFGVSFYRAVYLKPLLFGLGIKILVDLPILWAISGFMGKKNLRWYILPFQILYPLYIGLVTVLAFATKNSWKGRPV